MIVAGGRTGAEGASRAAAGAGDFDVTDVILYVSEMLLSRLNGKMNKETKKIEEWERRFTGAQQKFPQQTSPATQNVSPQHVDPDGMQKGATLEEVGMQHWSVLYISECLCTILQRAQLTTRAKTLAAHVPRTKVIRTAREDPCVAGSNIMVKRRCEGREDDGVGSRRVGKEGGGCGVGCEGWR